MLCYERNGKENLWAAITIFVNRDYRNGYRSTHTDTEEFKIEISNAEEMYQLQIIYTYTYIHKLLSTNGD